MKTVTCRKCGHLLTAGTKFCAACGKRSSSLPGLVFIIVVALGMALALIGIHSPPTSNAGALPQPSPSSLPNLELVRSSGSVDAAGIMHIEGTLRNNTSRSYRYVAISFDVYNEQGDKVGDAFTNVRGLDPGQTWAFDALSFRPGGTRFRLGNVSGY
jgi:hypothetical protein